MKVNIKPNWLLTSGLLLLLLLTLSTVWQQEPKPDQSQQRSERINLALRQTGDRLLDLAGDHTSAIPPVRQLDEHTWLLRLERSFEYDSLPPILRTALQRHQVSGDYNVSVLRCVDQTLMLGYTSKVYEEDRQVACSGRDVTTTCLNIQLRFLEPASQATWSWKTPLLILSSIFITVALMAFFYRQKKPVAPETLADETPLLRFGQSSLHPQNQQLLVRGQEKKLTFRETKLLHYLVEHANQVLDREQILAAVWQDEGVLVGRSLDVFVSRLRKLLQDDASINIASVHSVGYRFETELPAS